MSKLLYLDDCYLKEFEAVVVSGGNKIVLDQTAFYPESGGQLSDHGVLARLEDSEVFAVKHVQKSGDVFHEVDHAGLEGGDKVVGKLDWKRRYKLMQAHTAAHVLSAVFHQEAGALITGNQLGLDKSRIDFNLENFNRAEIEEYFRKANEAVARNLEVKISYISGKEAEKDPGLFKLAKILPAHIKNLRIVEIAGFDRQADGGTHIARLGEIGNIKFIKAENKGKNNRRVYFELG